DFADEYTPVSRGKKGNEKEKSTSNSKVKASKVKKEETGSDDECKPKSQKRSPAAGKPKISKIKKPKDEYDDTKVYAIFMIYVVLFIVLNYFLDSLKEEKKIKKEVGIKKDEKKAAGVKKEGAAGVKKERKVYELPGQKHDPPPERDPLRIFYESLYEQVPDSEMAAFWLMEWGLLPLDVATEVFAKKQGQKQVLKLRSPVKAPSTQRRASSPTKKVLLLGDKKTNSGTKGKTTAQKKRASS
uniref:Uncharacterized protein n=1 Tax=Aegilops tauschii subsp. strangulata TaxID=200361 RepID=A0A453IHV4_AEGTS